MKGGAGFRLRSPRFTAFTVKGAPWSDSIRARVAASFGRLALSPRTSLSVATNSGGVLPRSRACSDQYSTGTNARISRSRSTISRSATDCTRPAESPRRTFSQSSGDSL